MLDIRISLDRSGVHPDLLEQFHEQLQVYLDEAGLDQVRPVRSDVDTAGARGMKEFVLGVFDAVIPKAGTALGALARSLSEFVRRSGHDVELEIRGDKVKVGKASPRQVEQLIEHFIAETTTKQEQ